VLDYDERLALGLDLRPVEGVAGYDVDVGGEPALEGGYFGVFT
jgi:hypothetical protein